MNFWKKKKNQKEQDNDINWNYVAGLLLSNRVKQVIINSEYLDFGIIGTDENRYELASRITTNPPDDKNEIRYRTLITLTTKEDGPGYNYFPRQFIESSDKIVHLLKGTIPRIKSKVSVLGSSIETIISKE